MAKIARFPSFPFPSPSPFFHFFALISFLSWPKPKIPLLGLSLLRNQTETLATQAIKIHFQGIGTVLFLSHSFGIGMTNTFIQTRSSLENHARFHSKMAQKPYPIRRHIPTRLIKSEYLPRGGGGRVMSTTQPRPLGFSLKWVGRE